MSKVVDEEEFEILKPPQIPGWHITIKEEALECIVPADAENSQVIARRIPLVDSWNECVNYQRIQEHQEREEHLNNLGDSRENNNANERHRGQHDKNNEDDGRPPGRRPEQPEPREPPAPHKEHKAEEPPHLVTRAWSLPSPHDLCATMPGMNAAVKLHMDHMHDRLNHLVDDSLGVRFKFPDGVKPRRAEGKHIQTYSGGHKFSQLEDWAMDVCYHLAALLWRRRHGPGAHICTP
ncbi:hypothetical protein C0995_011603 [Termitomyces sp. Mi166|nr:hypothetical protein C0995_011603 [Termitomyces sp. Mi166\